MCRCGTRQCPCGSAHERHVLTIGACIHFAERGSMAGRGPMPMQRRVQKRFDEEDSSASQSHTFPKLLQSLPQLKKKRISSVCWLDIRDSGLLFYDGVVCSIDRPRRPPGEADLRIHTVDEKVEP